MEEDIYFMNKALDQAKIAFSKDEVPVGAIVVQNNKIIAKAYNKREESNSSIAHAELLAINEACKLLKRWKLNDCTLYVTLEPCVMCTGVIINSRIKKVVFGAKDSRWISLEKLLQLENISNHKPEIISNILEYECSELIKNYFKSKR